MTAALLLLIAAGPAAEPIPHPRPAVGPVPAAVREAWKLDPFYRKYADAGGLPVVGGPILFVLCLQHTRGFGSDAAAAALMGMVPLTAFVVVYGRLAARWSRNWPGPRPRGRTA